MSGQTPSEGTPSGATNFTLGGWPGFPSSDQQPAPGNASNTAPANIRSRKNTQHQRTQQNINFIQQSNQVRQQVTTEQVASQNTHSSVQQKQPNRRTRQARMQNRNSQSEKTPHDGMKDEAVLSRRSKKSDVQNVISQPGGPQQGPSTGLTSSTISAPLPIIEGFPQSYQPHVSSESLVTERPHLEESNPMIMVQQPTVPEEPETPDPSLAISKPIEYNERYKKDLDALISSYKDLVREGYVLRQLTREELEAKKRCANCNKFTKRPQRKENFPRPDKDKATATEAVSSTASNPHLVSSTGNTEQTKSAQPPPPNPIMKCQYHPGEVREKFWTCCKEHLMKPGCTKTKEHESYPYAVGQLEREWLYHETPYHTQHARPAVALDCEMGTAKSGDTVLIRISLMDYFTGEKLIDSLVLPSVPIQHYNTRFSGVTARMMNDAKKRNRCLQGTAAARAQIWRYVDPETLVIGHSAHNDLKALRWIHYLIVDSFMLEPRPPPPEPAKDKKKQEGDKEATAKEEPEADTGEGVETKEADVQDEETHAPPVQSSGTAGTPQADPQPGSAQPAKPPPKRKGDGPRSLKTLARVKLGRFIQDPARPGHDSVEDALAARDLVHWAVLNRQRKAAAGKDILGGASQAKK